MINIFLWPRFGEILVINLRIPRRESLDDQPRIAMHRGMRPEMTGNGQNVENSEWRSKAQK
jgi:hypothetical protein